MPISAFRSQPVRSTHEQRKYMQVLSNEIAQKVVRDILHEGEVKPLADILHRDISIALDDGKVSLGG